ncbi:hypothetical protein, partial [Escherichia coli]|uniref:hypothetical protein n=1 Tax=Escherichia coli TaxID=562 RepID=UPI0024C19BFA
VTPSPVGVVMVMVVQPSPPSPSPAMHSRNIENMNQMANAIDTSIFVKNGPCIAGLGLGGEGWTTMTITTPTGEGVTSARTFVRLRRCVLVDAFRIV